MIEPRTQPDRPPTKTRLRILQTLAWINVAAGAFLACGGLLVAFAYIASSNTEPENASYLGGLFVVIPLCIATAFVLTGRGFLKKKTQEAAEVSASGFAILIWFTTRAFFQDLSHDHFEEHLLGLSAGILFAYACFLAIKRLVIKPHFAGTVE